MEEHEPKISLPEALIAGPLLFGIPDLIELIFVFFGLDTFWITDALSFPSSQIYLRMKGVKATQALVGNVLELIPYIGALPLRTIGFIMVVWLDHHPKAQKLVESAVKKGTSPKAGGKAAAPKTAKPTPGATQLGETRGGRAQRATGATPGTQPVVGVSGGTSTQKAVGAIGEATPDKAKPGAELFREPPGPIEKLRSELAKPQPFPERKPIALDEETNTVDLRGV